MKLRLACLLCLFLLPLIGSEDKFWDKQDRATWTPAQATQFVNASPWAKQVTAVLTSNDSSLDAAANPRSGSSGGRIRGGGGTRSASSDSTDRPAIPKFQAIVRWVSAPLMRQVLKAKLPETFKGHYVISVTGLPIGGQADSMAEQTTLQVKRGDQVHPEIAYQDPNDTGTIYFAFLPSTIDVSSGKVAEFNMQAAPFEIRVKFNLNDMKVHGEASF